MKGHFLDFNVVGGQERRIKKNWASQGRVTLKKLVVAQEGSPGV